MLSDATPFTDSGLAKRLAEAADSFRDDLYHYFVCKTSYPYDLHYTSGYSTDEEANNEADSIKSYFGDSVYFKFGPYKTAAPEGESEPMIDYDAMELKFLNGGSEVHSVDVPGDADVIVLSISAYDKFLQPYYIRLYGAAVAADMRAAAVSALTASSITPLLHKASNPLFSAAAQKSGGTFFAVGSYLVG